jgi:hypothetical protein
MASKTIKQITSGRTSLDLDLVNSWIEGEDNAGSFKVDLPVLKDKFQQGVVVYVGPWNAATNIPNLTSGGTIKGQYWVVSTSGTTTLGGISIWKKDDWAVYNGLTWNKIDNSSGTVQAWGVSYTTSTYPLVTNVEEALDSIIETGLTSLSTDISVIVSGLTLLSTSLSIEISTRTSADISLTSALSTETSLRISGDTSLSIAITNIISSSGDTVIGLPTDGTYSDGIFPFTPTTRLADAVDDFNEMFLLLAPTPPSSWNTAIMTLSSTFSARALTSGGVISGIITNVTPTFTVVVPAQGLSDATTGNLTFDVNSVIQETYGVTGTTNKSTGVIRYTSGDPYIGQSGKAGFWSGFTSASTVSTTLTASSSQKTAHYIHSTKGTISKTFYLDNPLSVTITPISASVPTMSRYVSGVPSLAVGDSITGITFNINNVSSYFYSSTSVWRLNAGLVTSQTGDPNSIPTSYGETGSVSNKTTTILSNQFSDTSLVFDIQGRNSIGTYGTITTYTNNSKRVDTVSTESERLTSGTGNYPISYGSIFTSSASLIGANTMELQLINGYYKWPVNFDYSSYDSGPNYTGITTGDNISGVEWRWATFNVGTKSTAVSNVTITITSGTIGTSYTDIKMYVKIGASGWLDATLPQSVVAPYADGDAALDVAGSTPYTIRKVTFGTTPRSGIVYVRIGIKASDTTFQYKLPTMA